MSISVFINTAISAASKTLKNSVLKMIYCLLEGNTEEQLQTRLES